uniref:Leukotriene A(4) hydrolase n=1 Tax=Strigamia maritima TaxID=126957 RepID=T1JM78_STRMM
MATSLSPRDPNSYSCPEDWETSHVDIEWNVNFEKRILEGRVDLTLEKRAGGEILFLDTRDLQIKNVSAKDGTKFRYKLHDPIASFGSKLEIFFAPIVAKSTVVVRVEYETSPECSALQWLNPQQTAGKKHPYVFSQCQAIHARSLLPCQDSPGVKATYSASVRAPEQLQVLMSAIRESDVSERTIHRFDQPVPIPSYLIALAVGAVEFRKISDRCGVWTEKETLDAAEFEFSETEAFLTTGESLMGPYVWERYDLLVLPPSFPFGGMENPCLTFVTPTLLAGDRSLSNVVAHEIAHSWTGNLVTNRNFEHFWLNEGFTVFLERKIVGRLMGENYRHFQALIGWKELVDSINTIGVDSPLTNLVVDLKGVDPDDAFSTVPYEKGHAFLFYLENLVGGADVFEPFLKTYIEKFSKKSVDTNQWKEFFLEYFSVLISDDRLAEIDWNAWLYTPGLPPVVPKFDDSLAIECKLLCERWIAQNDDFAHLVAMEMTSLQMCYFLSQLLECGQTLSIEAFEALTTSYSLLESRNSEIKFRWIRLGIRSRWSEIVPHALKFVSEQGRMKFVRPVFRDLYGWLEMRQRAVDKYQEIKNEMMHVTAAMVAKDLKQI